MGIFCRRFMKSPVVRHDYFADEAQAKIPFQTRSPLPRLCSRLEARAVLSVYHKKPRRSRLFAVRVESGVCTRLRPEAKNARRLQLHVI